jgi:hypothetical protein
MPMTMEERLDHARAAINGYMEAKGEPAREGDNFEDTDVSDVSADLLHLQKTLKLRDVDKTLGTARMHFEAEQEDEELVQFTEEEARVAFDRAIAAGVLSIDEDAENAASAYMFMGALEEGDAFKHIGTRRYVYHKHGEAS